MRRLPLERRREKLIDAAIRVIERDGIAGATVRAIVTEADMPLGAFHYAFGSRDELFPAIIEHVTNAERIAAWTWAHASSATQGRAGIEQLIREGLEGYFTVMSSTPGQELALLEVAFHAIRHDPSAVDAQWALYREAAHTSLEQLAALAGVHWTRPVDELAGWLNQAIDGLTVNWLATRNDASARSYIGLMANAFAGFAAPAQLTTVQRTPEEAIDAHHA